MLDKLRDIVQVVAPGIATALGGPLAGAATHALSQALLGKSKASSKELFKALSDPAALVKAQEAEYNFLLEMERIGIDQDKLDEMAVNNARQRQVDMARAGAVDHTTTILAFMVTIGNFALVGAVMFVPIQEAMLPTAELLIGAMTTAWISVITYYFGTSRSSRRKDELMAMRNEKA